jgi:hypothetical protein
MHLCVYVYICICVCVCVRACVRACVHLCGCASLYMFHSLNHNINCQSVSLATRGRTSMLTTSSRRSRIQPHERLLWVLSVRRANRKTLWWTVMSQLCWRTTRPSHLRWAPGTARALDALAAARPGDARLGSWCTHTQMGVQQQGKWLCSKSFPITDVVHYIGCSPFCSGVRILSG